MASFPRTAWDLCRFTLLLSFSQLAEGAREEVYNEVWQMGRGDLHHHCFAFMSDIDGLCLLCLCPCPKPLNVICAPEMLHDAHLSFPKQLPTMCHRPGSKAASALTTTSQTQSTGYVNKICL